jgi:adenylate cyclase
MIEIERKFLVLGQAWRGLGRAKQIRQGYLKLDAHCAVRVRQSDASGSITVTGPSHDGVRIAFDNEIPATDAQAMLDTLCIRPLITKTRHEVRVGSVLWQIDEFHDEFAGLILAEVEVPTRDFEVALPPWVGTEVTGDPWYLNQNMVARKLGSA